MVGTFDLLSNYQFFKDYALMDVRSLFSDAFSVTQDCIALNEGMIREW
jgi:hypothetical protein